MTSNMKTENDITNSRWTDARDTLDSVGRIVNKIKQGHLPRAEQLQIQSIQVLIEEWAEAYNHTDEA